MSVSGAHTGAIPEETGMLPPPLDRRAKLVVLTKKGEGCVEAGRITIEGLEDEITQRLGQRGHHQLRRTLAKLLEGD